MAYSAAWPASREVWICISASLSVALRTFLVQIPPPMRFNSLFGEGRALLGIERNTTSHLEKCLSASGALLGILVVHGLSSMLFEDATGKALLVASMGASAVLLFAVPHGALSQPWPLIGGHLISALIGVACQRWIADPWLAAALAVGLAVGAMHYLRCIHPPGGATALTAVIGGTEIQALGFGYVLNPILLNALVILLVAVGFNLCFRWRRYPAHLAQRHAVAASREAALRDKPLELTHEDFAAALEQLDSFVDITSEGLIELLEQARQHAEQNTPHPRDILPGRCYSNGKLGRSWSVRQVIDVPSQSSPRRDQLIYKVLAGHGAYETGLCHREDFRLWARYEVACQNGHWCKVEPGQETTPGGADAA